MNDGRINAVETKTTIAPTLLESQRDLQSFWHTSPPSPPPPHPPCRHILYRPGPTEHEVPWSTHESQLNPALQSDARIVFFAAAVLSSIIFRGDFSAVDPHAFAFAAKGLFGARPPVAALTDNTVRTSCLFFTLPFFTVSFLRASDGGTFPRLLHSLPMDIARWRNISVEILKGLM